MRKTFSVREVQDKINDFLLNSPDAYAERRRGQMNVLEDILHATGNYRGFRYLSQHDMNQSEFGNTLGIREQIFNEDGTHNSWNFDDTDRTRVQYS